MLSFDTLQRYLCMQRDLSLPEITSLHAEIVISGRDSYLCMQRYLNLCRDSCICAEIALFVLNLSDIIFLQTAPHCHRATILLARMKVNGNFSDTNLERLRSISTNRAMSPSDVVDLESSL